MSRRERRQEISLSCYKLCPQKLQERPIVSCLELLSQELDLCFAFCTFLHKTAHFKKYKYVKEK